MLARLDRRLPVLAGGPHDLPARQKTMRDAIAWSYELLDPPEQALFRRMCVFTGGCTLDAAETICADDRGGPSVLDGLAALVASSLLRIDETAVAPRVAMLETIREYGSERLAEHPEATPVRPAGTQPTTRMLAERAAKALTAGPEADLAGRPGRRRMTTCARRSAGRGTGDAETALRLDRARRRHACRFWATPRSQAFF